MKFLSLICAFGLIFSFSSCKEKSPEPDKGITMGRLHISKSYPKPRDTLSIRYEIDSTKREMPEAFYNYLVHNRYYPVDIQLKEVNGVLAGDLVIPDSATAIAFNFKIDETFDGNDKEGYVQFLYDENDSILANSKASMGYYYITAGKRFEIYKSREVSLALMEDDFKKNPDLASKWDFGYSYPIILAETKPMLGKKLSRERIAKYSQKKNLSEKEYQNLASFYFNIDDKVKRDSIINVATKKFPRGNIIARQMSVKFQKEKDVIEKIKIFEDYVSYFGKNIGDYNYMLGSIAREFSENKDWDRFSEYANQISNKQEKAFLYNGVAWKLAEKGKNLDFAETISKESLDIVKALQAGQEKKPDYYSQKQYEKSLSGNFVMFADTYAYVLFKQEKLEEALEYQIMAMGDKPRSAQMNERYIQFLMANKKFDEAEQEAALFIKENRANTKISQYLKEAYVFNKGSKAGFEDYIAGLEKESNEAALNEIKGKMIDEEGYDFTLKNLKGEKVTLTNLRGKVVILDFWATWCGPCKDSFPGMQIALNKYKDNPNVVFLFIDTLESGTPQEIQENVSKFIAENKYTFNVLFDQPVKEGSRNYMTTNDYEIKGIPTKIILGPEGNIRFKSVGYMGDNDQLVKELDVMIELASKDADYDFEQKT